MNPELEHRQILRIFTNIKQKCENKQDKDFATFGKRGIKLCPQWQQNFLQFKEDIGPRQSQRETLHLIDSWSDFKPGNVRWGIAAKSKGRRGQRGALTDDDVLEILRLVHEEGVKVASVALGFPASVAHIRHIALGSARRVEGYPYPYKLYSKRTEAQITREEGIISDLWGLVKKHDAKLSELSAALRSMLRRKPQ